MSAQSNSPFLPVIIAAGAVDGATGAGSSLYGVAAAGVARTGKGTYTITLGDKPTATTVLFSVTSIAPTLRIVKFTSYVAATGVLTLAVVDAADAAQDGSFNFLILVAPTS